MKKIAFTFILGACVMSAHANAASFDCAKAGTWVEKTICSNAELSQLDEVMAQEYKAKLASAIEYDDSSAYKKETRNAQRNWLKFQRNSCKSEECLIREYKEHTGERSGRYLDNLDHSEPASKQAFGTFDEEVDIAIYNADTKAWGKATPATNSIAIHSIAGKPSMSIIDSVLIFTNAHTCHIDSEVATWSENHWVLNGHQDETAELRLYPATYKDKTQLLLRDIDNQYRILHCGMRGYFDGKVFESK